MSLEVIGPGFGRTGTMSLKLALEQLGFGPTHHMEEVFAYPEQVPVWQAIAMHQPADWRAVFAGYRSQVDWPGAHVWRQLCEAFPKAKVVLSVRPEDSWWKSFSATIAKLISEPDAHPLPPHIRAMLDSATKMVQVQTFHGPVTDRELALKALRQRTIDVRAAVSPERLLVFDVSEGWGPLCDFLQVPVPATPFPHVNSTEGFWKLVRGEGH